MVVHWNPRRWGYSLIRLKRRTQAWAIMVVSWMPSLGEVIVPCSLSWSAYILNAVSRSGYLMLAGPTEQWRPAWWRVQSHALKGKLKNWGCWVSKKGRGVLMETWEEHCNIERILIWERKLCLPHEAPENKIGTNKWKLRGRAWQSRDRDSCLGIRSVQKVVNCFTK